MREKSQKWEFLPKWLEKQKTDQAQPHIGNLEISMISLIAANDPWSSAPRSDCLVVVRRAEGRKGKKATAEGEQGHPRQAPVQPIPQVRPLWSVD
jgi:hypothetical protein